MARAYGTGVGARRGHWFLLAIMLLLVLRHPTCVHHVLHECIVGCPILSSKYEHVPINHRGVDIAIYRTHVVLRMCCNSIKHV